jgi:hypothetical protein
MTNLIAAFRNFAQALDIKLLMLCREIVALCSDVHIKHVNTLCEQKVENLISNLVVGKVNYWPLKD